MSPRERSELEDYLSATATKGIRILGEGPRVALVVTEGSEAVRGVTDLHEVGRAKKDGALGWQAKRHWKAYLDLCPNDDEYAPNARKHLKAALV